MSFRIFLYDNKYINNNNINKEVLKNVKEVIESDNIKELVTENGIVKEIKIIVIKEHITNILFNLGGKNYV